MFPLLAERTFRDLLTIDERLTRKLPLCSCQHYCTSLLNAVIIDVSQNENREGTLYGEGDVKAFLDYIVPGPIGECFSLLTKVTTTAVDQVRMNIPDVAIPRKGVDAGSFGVLSQANRNVYECYASTLVTWRKIERLNLLPLR